MRRCISEPTIRFPRPAPRSVATSASTTPSALIRALTGKRQTMLTSVACSRSRQPEPGRGATYLNRNAVQTNRATGLHQPFDRAMTDAAYSRSLAQTNSLRIRQGSLLTGNGMVAPGCRHSSLVPSLPFAGRIPASVQYRGNLVVTVASSHTANDIQRLHRCGGFRCGTRPLHRNLRMHTSLPVNHQLKGLVILVIVLGSAHDDLVDGGAEDHLLECRRTVVTLPDFSKAITHRAYSDFLFN